MGLNKIEKAVKRISGVDVKVMKMSSEFVCVVGIRLMDLIKDESYLDKVDEKLKRVYNAMFSMSLNKVIPLVVDEFIDKNEFLDHIQPNIEYFNRVLSQDLGDELREGEGFTVDDINYEREFQEVHVLLNLNDVDGRIVKMVANKMEHNHVESYFENLSKTLNKNVPIKNGSIYYVI